MSRAVTVIGAGLAGCEAAWQLAKRGVPVELVDMKPAQRTPAHHMDTPAELVCSNSLRGAGLSSAVGLLKAELRRLDSLLIGVAESTSVPAGRALAVDRHLFSQQVQQKILQHPLIQFQTMRADTLPGDRPVIVATGPLTEGAFIEEICDRQGMLNYHDAIAPLIAADSIDWECVYRKDRYEDDPETASYVNCPFDKEEYLAFVNALVDAEKTPLREFETAPFFEGCLPVEEMARRGIETLSHGPLKPVGLIDPRTDRRPWAVVQLRREDSAGTAYNLVGFQTRLTRPAQQRVFRMIPGLANAVFERFGQVHRNTFINAPAMLDAHLRLIARPNIRIAGQLSGVEGYVESIASGLLCGIYMARELQGRSVVLPPVQTALGAIARHTARNPGHYQPSNIVWAMIETPIRNKRQIGKADFRQACAERALSLLGPWADQFA